MQIGALRAQQSAPLSLRDAAVVDDVERAVRRVAAHQQRHGAHRVVAVHKIELALGLFEHRAPAAHRRDQKLPVAAVEAAEARHGRVRVRQRDVFGRYQNLCLFRVADALGRVGAAPAVGDAKDRRGRRQHPARRLEHACDALRTAQIDTAIVRLVAATARHTLHDAQHAVRVAASAAARRSGARA